MTITSVVFDSTMSTKFQQLHISKLEVRVNGGAFRSPSRLALKAGDKLEIRVSLSPFRSTSATTKTLRMTVPTSARGQSGQLTVTGGVNLASAGEDSQDLSCLLFGECASPSGGTSLNGVIKAITSAPKNNQVVAELQFESDRTGDVVTAARASTSKSLTVTGERDIAVSVGR